MPASARKDIVADDQVGVYHVWGRCVRRAFLCGVDPVTDHDYSHRRDWTVAMEESLAALFAIEVGFHAEMSNHLHLVLRTRPDIARTWSDEDVVRRMLTINQLTRSPDGVPREVPESEIRLAVKDGRRVASYRRRLSSISWFMKALRENIARRSNLEDDTDGAFWSGRFRSRRLVDETSIVICGIYVDLNQIRAGEAQTPEDSTHTSAHDRILGRAARAAEAGVGVPSNATGTACPSLRDGWLGELTLDERMACDSPAVMQSASGRRASDKGWLGMSLDHYLELLDITGRLIQAGKAGAIPAHLAPILERLGVSASHWPELVANFHDWFGNFAGHVENLAHQAARLGLGIIRGIRQSAHAFVPLTDDPAPAPSDA